jgi:hypothetical protein
VPAAAGEVAFEAAERFAVRLAFGAFALEVGVGLGMAARADDRDAVDGGVDLAVAAAVEVTIRSSGASVRRPRRARQSMDGRPARAGSPYGAQGLGGEPSAADRARGGRASNASFGRVTTNELAAFYRRYNACCNEHRFEDLAGVCCARREDRRRRPGLVAYAAELRAGVAPPHGRRAVDRRARHRDGNTPRGILRRPGDRPLCRRPGVRLLPHRC